VDCSSVIIVGDLHGNIEALDFILAKGEELNCKKYIFLGDYIDKGSHSVELLSYLFKLKINQPDNFILLRGNHETAGTNEFYGLYDDLNEDDELFSLVNRTFEKMPIAAVFSEKTYIRTSNVFCVHGGMGEPVTLDQITKEDYHPYLWNDPQEENGLEESPQRSGAQVFGPDICEKFRSSNNIDIIIRAHSELDAGYKWWFDGKLLSLFSTPEYCGSKNRGAFVFIEQNGNCWVNEELKTFVFGRVKNGPYSLLKVISHNLDRFEFYDSETDHTVSIVFRFFNVNNILVIMYNNGNDIPCLEGAVIVYEYTFIEPDDIEKVILECRSIKKLDNLYALLDKYSHEWKVLLEDVE
jgi:serine/threonine-protein phosphatase PP1 catalytic subunit